MKGTAMLNEARDISSISDETATRRLLHAIADELAARGKDLAAVRDALAVSPRADVMLLGEETADFSTEVRRTIDCALVDHLAPLVHALRMAADYTPESEED
jgi:hypothetical protein